MTHGVKRRILDYTLLGQITKQHGDKCCKCNKKLKVPERILLKNHRRDGGYKTRIYHEKCYDDMFY